MKATVTAEDPLPNLNGHNGIHVSSIPTASPTRSWSVDVPLHMLQGLQQDGGKWSQAGDHRGGDGKVPPPSDVDRSGSGDQTKRTPSDPQHHLRTPRHEHEQQRPRPLSTSDWAALRRMGSGRLMPAGIGSGLSALCPRCSARRRDGTVEVFPERPTEPTEEHSGREPEPKL
eukprot:989867-Rhodomonas_salina.3